MSWARGGFEFEAVKRLFKRCSKLNPAKLPDLDASSIEAQKGSIL